MRFCVPCLAFWGAMVFPPLISTSHAPGCIYLMLKMTRYSSSSVAVPSPVHSDEAYAGSSTAATSNYQPLKSQQSEEQQQQGKQKDPSECTTAMGLDKILHHSPVSQPPRRLASAPSRYHLHIRQQPIAARACGAGDRDRRPVDPSPIVQMLLTDFDPTWPPDLDLLQDPRFTVGCLLYPAVGATALATSTINKESRTVNPEDNLPGQSTPLLSGKAFVSPFYVNADPDPDTAPAHPIGKPHSPQAVLGLPNLRPGDRLGPSEASREIPATFFIFSDLSVRTAGLYQFQFRLMNWGNVEDTGQSMPILAEAWSEPFRVYPAKDFPGMRDSSPLAEGLKELGFVELKTRGKGKGKGRKR